jgi:hypothetical protein
MKRIKQVKQIDIFLGWDDILGVTIKEKSLRGSYDYNEHMADWESAMGKSEIFLEEDHQGSGVV